MSTPPAQPSASWPIWATEPVQVGPYDPAWVQAGIQQCGQLQHLLAPWVTGRLEHVGSTAVPGLAAKPVIDLQAPVRTLEVADAVASALAPHGWHYVPPELDRQDDRRFYVRVVENHRAAHLHLMAPSSPRWQQQIAFRDALRADPDAVEAYAVLKIRLARDHRDDRDAYTAAKQSFIQSVLERT